MQSEKSPWFHSISIIIFCFIVANLVYLNILTLQSRNAQITPIAVTPTIGPSQILLTPTVVPTIYADPTAPVEVTTTKKSQPHVKEYFIPFGSGTSSSIEWADLLGIQAYIDGSSYPDIKSVTFEVSMHNVAAGQEVYVRLFNSTDNVVVWSSDVTYTGGNTSELLISKPITLSNARSLYKVQVKTQLGAPVMIDNSRLHIILN